MIEIAILCSLACVLAYVVRSRPRTGIRVICPLTGDEIPEEIRERLGQGVTVTELPEAEFTIGYMPGRPGASVSGIQDAKSLASELDPYLHRPVTLMTRDLWSRYVKGQKWDAYALFLLALEVLHSRRPDDLLVDLRPPDKATAHRLRIKRGMPDVDLAMYAYEILSRVKRYSRYRGADLQVFFCGKHGTRRYSMQS